jgi:Flp pilus assembly protein CpaB
MTRPSLDLRNVLIALALGAVAAAIAAMYASRPASSHTGGKTTARVLVAKGDIAIGTTADRIATGGLMATRVVSRADVAPGAITDPAQLTGLVATEPTFAGEQVSLRRFGSAGAEGERAGLKGDLRIAQLPGDANQLLAGTLRDGDRVDVVASLRSPESGENHYSTVVLRNLLVISAAADAGDTSLGDKPAQSVRLQLTDPQEQKLFWVEKNADWTLVLRPAVDPIDVPSGMVSSSTLAGAARG